MMGIALRVTSVNFHVQTVISLTHEYRHPASPVLKIFVNKRIVVCHWRRAVNFFMLTARSERQVKSG